MAPEALTAGHTCVPSSQITKRSTGPGPCTLLGVTVVGVALSVVCASGIAQRELVTTVLAPVVHGCGLFILRRLLLYSHSVFLHEDTMIYFFIQPAGMAILVVSSFY